MTDNDSKVEKKQIPETLTDNQIITERKLSRRSFLTASGALLAGAVALASGVKLMAQEKGSDPDKKKKRTKKTSTKGSMKKGSDPDKKKTSKTKKKAVKKSDPDSHRR